MEPSTQDIMIYVSMTVSIGSMIIHIINHKKCRSGCCGKKMEMSFDIDNSTPPSA